MSDADWDLLREDAVAELLRISVRTLQQARHDPLVAAECLLPAHEKHGSRVIYRRAAVEACLAERLQVPRLARKYHRQEEAVLA